MKESGEGLGNLEGIGNLVGSQRLNQPKSICRLDLIPPPQRMQQMCSLVFKEVPQQRSGGLQLPACGSCSPNWSALSDLSGRGCVQCSSDLRCQGMG